MNSSTIEKVNPYPGATATSQETVDLAAAFRASAATLLAAKANHKHASFDLSPFRLCALHAIELYLRAFLLAQGYQCETIRAMHHNVAEHAALAEKNGLVLRRKTANHLAALVQNREYLVSRYETDEQRALSQLNRLLATLNEVSTKVSKQLEQRAR